MIAVPVTAETVQGAIADIRKANEKADAIELRLDFLREANETVLQELLQECKKPAIVTFRDKNFGASLEQTERMFLLHKAVELGADYIDLDLEAGKELLAEFAQSKGSARVILSHHNSDGTPSLPELAQLLERMAALPCDVLKVVTYANSEADNDTVLALILAAKALNKPVIAFCMGPKGRKSRVECIKLGALLTFASLERGKESAEGQLTVDEMRKELAKNA